MPRLLTGKLPLARDWIVMTTTSYQATAGSEKFAAFLKERGLSDAEAGKRLHVTDVTVYHWRIGLKSPKDLGRRKIEKFTSAVDARGTVTRPGIPPSDWDPGSEEKALEEVTPFDTNPAPKSVRKASRPPTRAHHRPRAAATGS